MTTNLRNNSKALTPPSNKPWRKSRRELAITVGIFVLACLITFSFTRILGFHGYTSNLISFLLIYILIDFIYYRFSKGVKAGMDAAFRSIVVFAIFLSVLPIISILITVASRGYRGLHWTMFTKDMHSNAPTDPINQGGVLHAIIGTFLLVAIALVISIPIGLLTAIYLTEIKGRFTRPIKFLVQAMSGVPSIVAGLFVLAAIVYTYTKKYNSLEGSLALSILMIPTIARTAEEVLSLVPQDLRESGVALGGTQWRTVAQILLPSARSGLVTALILGVARVAGETAPIVLLTGGGDTKNWNILKHPMGSLPFYIWKEFAAGTPESITRAWSGIIILLSIVLVLFVIARFLSDRKKI
jgi:phosphate transport system permease protein